MASAENQQTPAQSEHITAWRDHAGYSLAVDGDTLAIVQRAQDTLQDKVSLDLSGYRMDAEMHDPDNPSLLKLTVADRW